MSLLLTLLSPNGGGGMVTLTGPVTGSGLGIVATSITAGAITLVDMANLAANSIIGNNTGSPATPIALTVAQVQSMLSIGPPLWVNQTTASVTISPNTNYVINAGASLVTLTIPVTFPFGATFGIVGLSSGGWQVAQSAGQSIVAGNDTTTVGATGFLASTLATDNISAVCTSANTTFSVYPAPFGNITVFQEIFK